jgi:hypothetical protein
MKKNFVLTIALMALGLAFVWAQTQAQQQELEQIARRSMNGLSPQDRQRVIQIMTDVYVAQGMPRQQAAALAEMAANSMFTADVGEMSPEQRRQFEEQDQSIQAWEQRQNQPQRPQPQQPQQRGEIAGWPTAAIFRNWDISNMRQPAGTQSSYTYNGNDRLVIYLTGVNSNTLQELKRQIETALKKQMEGEGSRYYIYFDASKFNNYCTANLSLEGNVIVLQISVAAG